MIKIPQTGNSLGLHIGKFKCFVVFGLLLLCNVVVAESSKIFLLTFPRSGTMWMLYCLGQVIQTYPDSFCVKHEHYSPNFIPIEADKDQDHLILLVRNYRECFIREMGGWNHGQHFLMRPSPRVPNPSPWHYFSDYFENFQYYESWNPENRLLVYYEDLMTDFETVMKEVSEFLEIDAEWLGPFMEHYQTHQNISISQYENRSDLGTCQSQGNDLLFHTKKLPWPVIYEMENFAETHYPHIYHTYLERYHPD